MVDHYVSAYAERIRNQMYQTYVTDALKNVGEAVAMALGGSYLEHRFADLFDKKEKDDRTGDEIALEIIKKAGLKTRQE